MANFSNQPPNINFANTTNYKLVVPKAPIATYFCQRVNIPDISGAGVIQDNLHATIYHPGDRLVFNDLPITFLLDEDLSNWNEIFKWMKDYGMPEDPTPQDISDPELVCDIEVIVYNNNSIPTKRFVFYGAFPIFLQGIDYETAVGDIDPIPCNVVFRYTTYDYFPLNNKSPCGN